MKRETLEALRGSRRDRRTIALVTELEGGAQRLVGEDTADPEIAAAITRRRTAIIDAQAGEVFVQVFSPASRLVVVGAVHIAQKLAPMAALVDLAVSVIDPRQAFATAERFPGIRLVQDWPDKALAAEPPDTGTAVVTLTHDPKFDDPALIAALRSPAFYIGALGSQKTHARRLDRLRAEGFSDADLARIRAPIGLALGAVSPGEIAAAILAEIIAIRRGKEPMGAAK